MSRLICHPMHPLTLLVVSCAIASGHGTFAKAPDGDRFIQGARRFADRVLVDGRDTYGKQKTPLFVDGLHAETMEPVKWKFNGETWILSNFASQQPLVRLLDGLTGLTGEARYREAAEDAARHALEHVRTPNGLLYWGGHLAWDLAGDKGVEPQGPCHELKFHRPYYRLMWRVDPRRTAKLMETVWAAHVLDWSLLDYNRHAHSRREVSVPWDHCFGEDVDVPFAAVGKNLSFLNTSVSLMHTGVMLSVLDRNEKALKWSRRLVRRWQQAKHPRTGLCGARLSYMPAEADRARKALKHVHPDVCEAKIVNDAFGRYRCFSLAQMQDAESLIEAGEPYAKVGREFLHWASDDLKVYAEQCYDRKTGQFVARLTDGTPVRWQETRRGYFSPSSFSPKKPDGCLLWGYATAYRLTGEAVHWQMARDIAATLGLGELGSSDGRRRAVNLQTDSCDWRAMYALLELHEATADSRILELATRIGDNVLQGQVPTGLFPCGRKGYGRTGDERPLALLHLAAAIRGKRDVLPAAAFDFRYFHARYDVEGNRKRGRIYDSGVY